jgi:hypothetical protein
MAFLKRFWNSVKRSFTKNKAKDIVDIISDGMTLRNAAIPTDVGFMVGMNKNQVESPIYSEVAGLVTEKVTKLRLKKMMNPDAVKFNIRMPQYLRTFIYTKLYARLLREEQGLEPDSAVKIFDNHNLDLKAIESLPPYKIAQEMENHFKAKMPQVTDFVENYVESITKMAVSGEEIKSDSAVKAKSKVSDSIRNVISGMVDSNGKPLSNDNVFRYLASVGTNTLGTQGFYEQVKRDAQEPNNLEAKRLYQMLESMDEGVKQSILTELSSLIQIPYKAVLIQEKDGKRIFTNPLKNESYDVQDEANVIFARLDNVQNTDAYQRYESYRANKDYWGKLKKDNFSPAVANEYRQVLSDLMQFEITPEMHNKLLKKSPNFYDSVDYALNKKVFNKKEPVKASKALSSFVPTIIKSAHNQTHLQNQFINTNGKSVSSTRFGYWISELNSLMKHDESYFNKMKSSTFYKNNPVFKYMVKKGESNWFIHDAIRNSQRKKGNVAEYTKNTKEDTILTALSYFANTASNDYYYQTIGVAGDRLHQTFFEVPRMTTRKEYKEALEKQAEVEQLAFDRKTKGMNEEQIAKQVEIFNKSSLNKMVDGKIYTPFDKKNYPKLKKGESPKERIAALKSLVNSTQSTEAIERDLVGKDKAYESLDQLLESYYFNESINRNALLNMYGGVAVDKSKLADIIKRGSGFNSGGTNIEIDKPIRFIVLDVKSPVFEGDTSDSMSFNGTHLTNHLTKQMGDLQKVGNNMKDQIFQVDPTTGKMLFVKMSSLNLRGKVGENNFTQMSDAKSGTKGYSEIGDAIIKIEEMYSNDPYIKVVDANAMKGTDGDFTPMTLDQFLDAANSKNKSALDKASFKKDITNYRSPFNLNKDLSKVPLSEQSHILSTQLSGITLIKASQEEILEFEGLVVQAMQESLRMKGNDYESSQVYQDLLDAQKFLNGLVNNMEDQPSSSIAHLFKAIDNFNKENKENPIKVYDHPSLINVTQQFISSKLSKNGIRLEIPGAYVQMIPNFGNDLGWYDDQGNIPEIAVPWSMFGNSLEQAQELMRSKPEGLRTVVVRVPASGEVSKFTAKVKYFTEGATNSAILPDMFTYFSDADHDGDKTFVYREDLNDDGTINENSTKNKLFNKLFELNNREEVRPKPEQSLDLGIVKRMVQEYNIDKEAEYNLSDYDGIANISSQMNFGGDAIGVLAVASKMLSMLSQSKESLWKPVTFGYNMSIDPNERGLTKGKDYQEFKDVSLPDLARLLQAALDIGKDPVLTSTGVNKYTISVATALTQLGVDINEIMGFLNDPVIVKLNDRLSKASGLFSPSIEQTESMITQGYMEEIDAPVYEAFKDEEMVDKFDGKPVTFKGDIEKVYRTADKSTYIQFVPGNELGADRYIMHKIASFEKQDLDTVKKYEELKEIGNDLKKLIPIIQLDQEIPNSGQKLNDLSKSFDEVRNDSKMMFSTSKLMNRPKIKHYDSIHKMGVNTMRRKFFTESPRIYDLAKSLGFTKTVVADSIIHQFSQKYLTEEIHDAEEFVYGMGQYINNVINSTNSGQVKVSHPALDSIPSSSNRDMAINLLNEYINKRVSGEEDLGTREVLENRGVVISEVMEQYEQLENSINESKELQKNTFFNYITTKETELADGTKVFLIQPKKDFRRSSYHVKDTIREDFKKLPQELQDNFINYQLLRHGINDKLGSMIEMLPIDLQLDVLKDINQANKNKTNYINENANDIMKNTMLSLSKNKQESEVLFLENGTAFTYDFGKFHKFKGEIYQDTGKKMKMGEKEAKVLELFTGIEFQVGEHFVKFGKSANQQDVREEAEENNKKCKGK